MITNLFTNKIKIVLGSSSPRRKELLGALRVPFTVILPTFEEQCLEGEKSSDYVLRNAQGKFQSVVEKLSPTTDATAVICCDTIVSWQQKIIEKPKDRDDAIHILSQLSGQTHEVYSGLCCGLVAKGGIQHPLNVVVTTAVVFKTLHPQEIEAYVQTDEPYDKAGSYAIQGMSAYMVERINGSFSNVVGLPMTQTVDWLLSLDE